MINFIFLSPNFPDNYWQFCAELHKNGVNVLGIGDQPYDELRPQLKKALTEYYKVGTLESYDQVYRAVAFFAFKYGRIDWLESNNEYWLEQNARLRTDFNINTGFHVEDMPRVKYKSGMKAFYQKAGIPTARYHLVDGLHDCLEFIKEVGYPVVVKPDNGVGANGAYKLTRDEELYTFLQERETDVPYIMEEFIYAEVNSYDAILDADGEPMFETGNVTPFSIMDIVNEGGSSLFYIVKNLAPDVRKAGRATVKAFGVKNRFVHCEFFRLTRDQPIGKKGDVVALEVNMRPSGGISPDMMNLANATNVYKIWADMVAFGHSETSGGEHAYCAFAGRRDSKHYTLSHRELVDKYAGNLRMVDRVPDALSGAMGNQLYVGTFAAKAAVDAFFRDALACEACETRGACEASEASEQGSSI